MFKSMKPLNWLESRIANFPKTKTTKTTKTIELVDFWGKKHTYAAHYTKKSVNTFDGFGVIRNVDKDGDYPFLTVNPAEFISYVFTTTDVRKESKYTWLNEETLRKAMQWALDIDISKTQDKYKKYIDIINK